MSKIISAQLSLYVPDDDIDKIRKLHNEDKNARHDSEIALRIAEGALMTKTPFTMFTTYWSVEDAKGGYMVIMIATPTKENKNVTEEDKAK